MPSTQESQAAEKVHRLNAALKVRRSSGGRWWSYSVSHKTFELLVGEPAGLQNVVITLAACEQISGPTSWNAQNLQVTFNPSSEEWEFEIHDVSAGFHARSRMLAWNENVDLLASPHPPHQGMGIPTEA